MNIQFFLICYWSSISAYSFKIDGCFVCVDVSRFILPADVRQSCLWIYPLRLYIILYLFGSSQFLFVYSYVFFLNFVVYSFCCNYILSSFDYCIFVFADKLFKAYSFLHALNEEFLVHLLVYLIDLNLGIIGTRIYFSSFIFSIASLFLNLNWLCM